MKYFICLPACHVTLTNVRELWTCKCDTPLLKYLLKKLRGTSHKNILGERISKKVGEFVHFNVFERQTKVMHGKITEW